MAILKAIPRPAKSRAGMRNSIEYILKDGKVQEGYVDMIGPAPDKIDWDSVYRSFIEEQELWGKTDERLCAHYVLSFHRDEQITPAAVLEFATELAGRIYDGHQVVIGVHQDKEHLHAHMVINAVSYIDGHKLHTSAKDLQRMKEITNQMCRERGLTVAEKGRHFDGSEIEAGDSITWTKDKYHLLENDGKKSYLVDCAIAITDAVENSASRDEFIREMGDRGWSVTWSDKRKNITFENAEGKKVRNSNLSKTFTIDLSKEALENEFVRTKERRARENEKRAAEQAARDERDLHELEDYYQQIADALAGGYICGRDGEHDAPDAGGREGYVDQDVTQDERGVARDNPYDEPDDGWEREWEW